MSYRVHVGYLEAHHVYTMRKNEVAGCGSLVHDHLVHDET